MYYNWFCFSGNQDQNFFVPYYAPMPLLTIYLRFEIDDNAALLTDFERGTPTPIADQMDKKTKLQPQQQRGQRQSKQLTVETLKPDVSQKPSGDVASVERATTPIESVPFFSGNPFVEKTQGILHLYQKSSNGSENGASASSASKPGPSQLLCMLAVPAMFTSHDLLQFLAPYGSRICKMRIIRDSSPNQYMTLVEFRDQQSADECYESCNGKPFNTIEKDICHLVYVSRVEVMKESEGASLPVENHTELPTCPVCLERMDETVDGILTVLCNHSFHGNCLWQWGDASCPVCRHSQTPELTQEQTCSICGKQQDLWICMICGHIGCGRYAEAHAFLHYQETQHTFSLEVGGQRVWDYAGDNYVHRLMLSKSDGKVVEFDNSANRPQMQADEKVDAVTLEYTYLLTNQLESQRLYFEEKMAAIERTMQNQMEKLKEDNTQISKECETLRRDLKQLQNEKQQLEKRLTQAVQKAVKATSELKTEADTNAILRGDQEKWATQVRGLEQKLKETVETKDKEVANLQEQVRDLMFHFEAETKLEQFSSNQNEDLAGAQVTVPTAPPAAGKHRKKHK